MLLNWLIKSKAGSCQFSSRFVKVYLFLKLRASILKRVSPLLQIPQLPVPLQNILHVLQEAAIFFHQTFTIHANFLSFSTFYRRPPFCFSSNFSWRCKLSSLMQVQHEIAILFFSELFNIPANCLSFSIYYMFFI